MDLIEIIVAHTRRALQLLAPDASAAAVHAVRKELKHARAILRLSRDVLPIRWYEYLRVRLRAAADSLGELRDSEVALRTCAALLSCTTKDAERAALVGLQRWLRLRHAQLLQRRTRDIAVARSRLCECLQVHLALDDVEQQALSRGLHRTYRKGRQLFKRATGRWNEDGLHAWRRQASMLRYQLQTVGIRARGFAKMARRSNALADVLGLEHDLFLLGKVLLLWASQLEVVAAMKLLRHQRAALRRRALKLGSKLYVHKAQRFAERCEQELHALGNNS
jgi:CHAD domain